ncbi:MAG: iron ABC transporter permease [Moraxellaceae bacterium]|nr:iron ABC transporter permease [Moraxellaceae bacterium]
MNTANHTPLPLRRRLPFRPDGWMLGTAMLALLLALPVLVVAGFVFVPAGEVWLHLKETVLAEYVLHSLWLILGVGTGVLLIGVPAAWLVSSCEFRGRRVLEWALLLPMAMPAYILAYTWTGLTDFAGPIQSSLRAHFGWSYGDYWFPELRSLPGAMLMLTLVLYPYVYLLARAAFLEQAHSVLEVARSLGLGPRAAFARVALPLARPAIVTGLTLALMETLADYGTVQYFGLTTFTTGIFRTWFGLGDAAAAAQLSAVLMSAVLLLILIERLSRRQARYHHNSLRRASTPRRRLGTGKTLLALGAGALPVLFGFLVPASQLTLWAVEQRAGWLNTEFLALGWNSLRLAAMAAGITVLLALLLAYGQRLRPHVLVRGSVRLSAMGYAVPGTVIAIGVMLPLAFVDNSIDEWMRAQFNISTGLLLSGTLVALLFAYAVRFMAVAVNTLEAGLGRIRTSMDQAARSLGRTPGGVIRHVHLPMLRTSLLTALLMVFVDVLKELPATLILRPFNFNTLAVRAFELASDERLAEAAAPALFIVLAGMLPVLLLARTLQPVSGVRHAED